VAIVPTMTRFAGRVRGVGVDEVMTRITVLLPMVVARKLGRASGLSRRCRRR
jgi:hypothetical protein